MSRGNGEERRGEESSGGHEGSASDAWDQTRGHPGSVRMNFVLAEAEAEVEVEAEATGERKD